MIRSADAVVLGGGIIGASVAHFLTRLGFGQVALLEKSRICGGSTHSVTGEYIGRTENYITDNGRRPPG